MIDLKKAQQVFNHYVHKYNISDDKVALKISHTYRVMQRCQEIVESLKLEQEDIELAGLIGLLHDIGRFEQYEDMIVLLIIKQLIMLLWELRYYLMMV